MTYEEADGGAGCGAERGRGAEAETAALLKGDRDSGGATAATVASREEHGDAGGDAGGEHVKGAGNGFVATFKRVAWVEARVMWAIAWPVAVSNLARQAMTITDVSIVGHLGVEELAAASTANIYMNITLFPVYRAIGPAGVSLMSSAKGQADAMAATPTQHTHYGTTGGTPPPTQDPGGVVAAGAEEVGSATVAVADAGGRENDAATAAHRAQKVGVFFQTTVISTVVYVAFTAAAWMATEEVMRATGVNATTSARGGDFARVSATWLPASGVLACVMALLQSLEVVRPQMFIYVACAGLNLLLNVYLVHGFSDDPPVPWEGIGFLGSPAATAVSRYIQMACLCVLVLWWRRDHLPYWGGWDPRTACRQLRKFWGIALPLALGALFEESQLEVVSTFAVRLGEADIATQNGVLNMFFFLTSAMYGVMTACETRMSHHLGAGRATHAQVVGALSGALSVAIGLIVGVTFLAARDVLGKVFSHDEEVVRLTSEICGYVGPSYFLISMFYTSAATLTAQQRTAGLAVAYLVGPWCVGVPLAYVLAFKYDQGLPGLWKGLIAGYATCTAALLVLVARSDWEGIAADVQAKLHLVQKEDTPVPADADATGGTDTLA